MAWTAILIILALAYGLPAVGILIPTAVSVAVFGISIAAGAVSLRKILSFDRYREMYQELLYKSLVQMDDAAAITRKLSQKSISTDTQITSSKKGFEYLNEIFVKRHQKILWKSVKQIAVICLALLCAVLLIFYLQPSVKARSEQTADDVSALLCFYHVCHQPRYRFYQSAVYEL